MKLRRIAVENVRSFLDRQELDVPGDISILIGPNGGGKTNLLDTVVLALRLFLLKSWSPRLNSTQEWPDRYDWINNDSINLGMLEKHSSGGGRSQNIELDIEITQTDVDNILRAKKEARSLTEMSTKRYTSHPAAKAAEWNTDTLKAGDIFTYRIIDGALMNSESSEAKTFQEYLETFEVDSRLRAENEQQPLSTPMISLLVIRSGGGLHGSVSLADFNEFEHKRSVDAASSRSAGSIVSLAIGRLAARYRSLLEMNDGKAKEVFDKDRAIESFRKTLRALGYDWNLVCTNINKNTYDIQLSKQGASFRMGAASSGEKELLIYLFAIYALNVRDALIVIDEPELHLHPRWQKTLLSMFEQLAAETGNQFIMATHSPVFVSPSSIQYVSRVFSEAQQSRIVRLEDSGLPEPKHLFSIVNSQNNERVFFADRVVLVEGPSDRIFFEALLQHFKIEDGTGAVYEVVSVGGKMFFGPYQKLLTACRVPHVVIADLDYVCQVGSGDLKALFAVSSRDVKEKVVDDPSSIDGMSLVSRMDEAINGENMMDLRLLWEYVKARQNRLRTDLSLAEQGQIDSFIAEQRSNGLFILAKGALEAYLPAGFKDKNMEKLIRLTSATELWDRLPQEGKEELKVIMEGIRLPNACSTLHGESGTSV